MSVLMQHGYAKADMIDRALERGIIGGVIFNPRFELPRNLASYLRQVREEQGDGILLAVDPHFFMAAFPDARLTNLPEYPFFQGGLTRAALASPRAVRDQVKATLDYQSGLPVSRMISPTVFFDDFTGPWSQIALSLASDSIDYHAGLNDAPPLWLAFVLDETALRAREPVDEFLDIVSAWDVAGFTFTVKQENQQYPALHGEGPLTNLLYVAHVLGRVNGFECVNEYTDLVGTLVHAAGGTHTATGWSSSLRRFPQSWLVPKKGGRRANARYTSGALMNSILVVPELEAIHAQGSLADVLSETTEDGVFNAGNPANVPWPDDASALHHIEVCQALADTASQGGTAGLDATEEMLKGAMALYEELEDLGVPFRAETGSRNARLWEQSLGAFRDRVSL